MSKVIAGPWVGEFGWELFSWQGHLRYLSNLGNQVTVIVRPGHEFIYSDFMEDFVYFNPGKVDTNMKSSSQMQPDKMLELDRLVSAYNSQGYVDIKPADSFDNSHQIFINYQEIVKPFKSNHIIIHPRSTNKLNTGYRNWSLGNWEELVLLLHKEILGLKIYNIGTVNDAFDVKGTTDIRGVSLKELAHFMCSAKLCIGPSSGPMHFASLCGTPHLVWTHKDAIGLYNNRDRYETLWNPLKTKVKVIDNFGWNPSVELIKNSIVYELGE